MKRLSELRLEWKRREGGGGATRRDYLDFVVDAHPLSEVIADDKISCLGWLDPGENDAAVGRLLLEEPADLPNGRRTLYVCPECGDIDCGAVSLVVERSGETIVWRDFGYETGYEPGVRAEGYEGVGPFAFDRAEYERALKRAL